MDSFTQKSLFLPIIISILLTAIVAGSIGYYIGSSEDTSDSTATVPQSTRKISASPSTVVENQGEIQSIDEALANYNRNTATTKHKIELAYR